MKFPAIFGATLLALTACGSQHDGPSPIVTGLKAQAQAAMAARAARKSGKTVTLPKLSRDNLDKIENPIVQISVARLGLKTLGVQVSENNGYTNFFTKGKQSFVFKDGHLTATRGLQFDLMARDIEAGERDYKYLSPQNKISFLRMSCVVNEATTETVEIVDRSYDLISTEEICRSPARAFKTRIWRDNNGKPWKAEQWLGPQLGFAVIEWLN